MNGLAATSIAAFLTMAILGPVRIALDRLGLLDVPNHRSSHEVATVRGGGVGVIAGLAATYLIAIASGFTPAPATNAVVGAAIALGTLGMIEDIRGLPVSVRLLGQAIITTSISAATIHILGLSASLTLPLAAVGVFAVNSANFMDGINGISALHGIIAGSNAALVGIITGTPTMTVMGALALGSFAGFTPWNVPHARIFLGDVGSYALGGMQWCLGLYIWSITGSLALGFAPFSIYAFDVSVTLAKRALRGETLTSPHREHTYQKVCVALGSHVLASGYAAVFTLTGTIIAHAVWAADTHPSVAWLGILCSGFAYTIIGTWITSNGRSIGATTP